MQKRVDELTEDVAMPQIPEETDEATWLIPLKRFCAQIVDVLVTRVQEHLAEVSWWPFLKSLSDSERARNHRFSGCAVSEEPREVDQCFFMDLSSEFHVADGDFAKAHAKSRRRTCLHACGTNELAEGAGAFSQKRVRRSAVDQIAQGCADDVVLEL